MSGDNPVALITGAANGLGWGLAQHYLQLGYDLLLVDRDQHSLNERESQLNQLISSANETKQKVVTLALDLLHPESVESIVNELTQTFGRLNLLINNAGITHRSLATATDVSVTEKIMALNLFVPIALTQGCLPLLAAQRQQRRPATIINMGSMAGWLPVMGRSSYCAAKSALHQYFETLRAELSDTGVHILMVYPSFLATNIEQNALSGNGGQAGHARSTIGRIQTVAWIVEKISRAHQRGQARLFPNRSIALASIFYRLLPSLFITLMRRKFSIELSTEQAL